MLIKNQIYEAVVTDYTTEGQGIAHVEGCAVFIPNAVAGEKIRLRIGARYTTGQIVLNDQTIQDFSVSLGLGFPLKLYSNNSSLGVMFEYGQMGTIKYNLVKENYFRISLHFTLQEKWYQRVKLE